MNMETSSSSSSSSGPDSFVAANPASTSTRLASVRTSAMRPFATKMPRA